MGFCDPFPITRHARADQNSAAYLTYHVAQSSPLTGMYHCIGPTANPQTPAVPSLDLVSTVTDYCICHGDVTRLRLTPLSHTMNLPVIDLFILGFIFLKSCMIYTSEQLSHDVHDGSFDPVSPGNISRALSLLLLLWLLQKYNIGSSADMTALQPLETKNQLQIYIDDRYVL